MYVYSCTRTCTVAYESTKYFRTKYESTCTVLSYFRKYESTFENRYLHSKITVYSKYNYCTKVQPVVYNSPTDRIQYDIFVQ